MIEVKVIRIGTPTVDVTLEDGATVRDAAVAAGVDDETLGSSSIKVNQSAGDPGTSLDDGDRVILAKGAKGN